MSILYLFEWDKYVVTWLLNSMIFKDILSTCSAATYPVIRTFSKTSTQNTEANVWQGQGCVKSSNTDLLLWVLTEKKICFKFGAATKLKGSRIYYISHGQVWKEVFPQKEKVYGGNIKFLFCFLRWQIVEDLTATLNTDTLNVSYIERVYSNLGVFMH